MPVSHAEKRNHREMSPCGLASNDETVRTQLRLGVLGKPESGRLAIIRTSRIRVLWGQPIIDACHGNTTSSRNLLQPLVLMVRPTERPPASVKVEVHAFHLVRLKDSDGKVTRGP